jgi:hypothetical protein
MAHHTFRIFYTTQLDAISSHVVIGKGKVPRCFDGEDQQKLTAGSTFSHKDTRTKTKRRRKKLRMDTHTRDCM